MVKSGEGAGAGVKELPPPQPTKTARQRKEKTARAPGCALPLWLAHMRAILISHFAPKDVQSRSFTLVLIKHHTPFARTATFGHLESALFRLQTFEFGPSRGRADGTKG
jgi:hypothetical protein